MNYKILLCLLISVSAVSLQETKESPSLDSNKEYLYEMSLILRGQVSSLTVITKCPNVTIDDLRFELFTRDNNDTLKYLGVDNATSLVGNRKIKFLIGGWLTPSYHPWIQDIRKAYLTKDDYAVIALDWMKFNRLTYTAAVCYLPKVAKAVADFFFQTKLNLDKIHIVGHSLGGQMSGHIGQNVQKNTGGLKVDRITGLDPAGPLFCPSNKNDSRLTADDAKFVDVIHTDTATFGCRLLSGTVDFYPNCGIHQVGCVTFILTSDMELLPSMVEQGGCSHMRAYHYMIESIHTDNFVASTCYPMCALSRQYDCELFAPKVKMGEHVPRTAKGSYYLATNLRSLYGRGNF